MEKHKRDGDLEFIIFLFMEMNRPKVRHRRADCGFGCWIEKVDNKRNGSFLWTK